ncbi:MAG: hypothetical protein Hals2KO_21620 [Halioglobus sp.]
MAELVRERILDAITTAVSGEYDTPEPVDEAQLPITLVSDEVDEGSIDEYGIATVVTPVVIGRAELTSEKSLTNKRRHAHRMYGALYTEMFEDESFGGLVESVEMINGAIAIESSKFVYAEIRFAVTWKHVHGDPFSQA